MSVKIIQDRLSIYQVTSEQDEENALKEITQEVALGALSRSDFFKVAAFQGGTCLRVFYGLDRFSEDLDFILLNPERQFSLEPYLKQMRLEFATYGYKLEVQDRSSTEEAVKKAFLKADSMGKVLNLKHLKENRSSRKLQIKLEVDSNPPAKSRFETKFHDFPFPFAVTIQDLSSLFAGKCHALLCREYEKGRDWYDFIWYASRKTPINFAFLSSALDQQGPWKGKNVKADLPWFLAEMKKKIHSLNWNHVKKELSRFLKPTQLQSLQIWSADFFLDRLKKLE